MYSYNYYNGDINSLTGMRNYWAHTLWADIFLVEKLFDQQQGCTLVIMLLRLSRGG